MIDISPTDFKIRREIYEYLNLNVSEHDTSIVINYHNRIPPLGQWEFSLYDLDDDTPFMTKDLTEEQMYEINDIIGRHTDFVSRRELEQDSVIDALSSVISKDYLTSVQAKDEIEQLIHIPFNEGGISRKYADYIINGLDRNEY